MNTSDIDKYLQIFPDNISKDDRDLFFKYLSYQSLNPKEIKKLESIYLENIAIQKNKLEKTIKTNNIKTLVTFISYSHTIGQPCFLENILDKNLRIFNNLSDIVLVYTSQTKNIFDTIKNSYQSLNIIGVLYDDISSISLGYLIYKEIRNIASSPSETIIDITLGMKIITISFYKLAIEKGIFTINWIEKNIPKLIFKDNNYSVDFNSLCRLPFYSSLEIMIEPKKENLKIYEFINLALKNHNFEAIQGYYNQIGNASMEFFYENLAQVFNFETFISMDFEYFYQKLEVFLKKISDYPFEREITLKFSTYVTYLLSLVYYEIDDNIEKRNFTWLNKIISNFKISMNMVKW